MTLNTGECCIRCFGACLLPFFRTPIWHDTYGVWTHCWRVKLACQACLCFLNFLMHIPQQNLLELPHLRLCLPHLLMWAQNHSAHATVSEHYLLSLLVHRIPPSPPPLSSPLSSILFAVHLFFALPFLPPPIHLHCSGLYSLHWFQAFKARHGLHWRKSL